MDKQIWKRDYTKGEGKANDIVGTIRTIPKRCEQTLCENTATHAQADYEDGELRILCQTCAENILAYYVNKTDYKNRPVYETEYWV